MLQQYTWKLYLINNVEDIVVFQRLTNVFFDNSFILYCSRNPQEPTVKKNLFSKL